MIIPNVGLHPEGDAGLWVFRMVISGIGQIMRGEATVQFNLAEEDLPPDFPKAMVLENVHMPAEMLLEASK